MGSVVTFFKSKEDFKFYFMWVLPILEYCNFFSNNDSLLFNDFASELLRHWSNIIHENNICFLNSKRKRNRIYNPK